MQVNLKYMCSYCERFVLLLRLCRVVASVKSFYLPTYSTIYAVLVIILVRLFIPYNANVHGGKLSQISARVFQQKFKKR